MKQGTLNDIGLGALRHCKCCGQNLPDDRFYPGAYGNGLRPYCIECWKKETAVNSELREAIALGDEARIEAALLNKEELKQGRKG